MALDRRTFTRFLARHRRGTAGLCAGLAVLSMGLALRPASLPTVAVQVAAHDLATGQRLAAADLRVVEVAAAIAPTPTSRTDPEDLVGRVLAAPVPAGEPVAVSRLVGSAATGWVGPPGTNPVPVRFADAGAVNLIDAGQRLDVLAAAGGVESGDALPRASVVAAGVLVLAVVRNPSSAEEGLLGGDGATRGDGAGRSDLVVLAATQQQALALAAAEAGSRLTFSILRAGSPTGTG